MASPRSCATADVPLLLVGVDRSVERGSAVARAVEPGGAGFTAVRLGAMRPPR